MKNNQEDSISLYDFNLPPERIAQTPADERTASRLMVLEKDNPPAHHHFSSIGQFLRTGDLLVRNTTKVFPARLMGTREGGGKSEVLLVHELAPLVWECMAKGSSRLKKGKTLSFGGGSMTAKVEEQLGSGFIRLRFSLDGDFWQTIEELGEIPLPPYIERGDEGASNEDRLRYQTVYAGEKGAVAAPTAGLHFTPGLFDELEERGVEIADLVLHVGPGTFRPVKSDRISEHIMDYEHYSISDKTAEKVNRAKREGRRVIAVGTTSTRALESAAKEYGLISPGHGSSDLFIRPPYRFKIISGLITNFHLPKSTLLMLVSSLCGRERLLEAYQTAIREEYRFYSYGDAMLVLP